MTQTNKPQPAVAPTEPFGDEIRAFEAADKKLFPAPGGVVFVGSSSIRGWNNLERDFANVPIIKRGFGGSQLADSVRYANRIVTPYKPRMVLLYAGDNDLAAGKTPQQVFEDFKAFIAKVRATVPDAKIAYIAIKPSPSRRHLLTKVREANNLIQTLTREGKNLLYIDVFTPMMGLDGEPRPELFVGDKLHLNAQGYRLWTDVVRPFLN